MSIDDSLVQVLPSIVSLQDGHAVFVPVFKPVDDESFLLVFARSFADFRGLTNSVESYGFPSLFVPFLHVLVDTTVLDFNYRRRNFLI